MQVVWCTYNVNRSIWSLLPLRSCRIIKCLSLSGDRVTDHAADTNHSVIRHNHQSRLEIVGDARQGHSIVSQHGWWWPLEHRAGENTRNYIVTNHTNRKPYLTYGDLDWPQNASRGLSEIAEFLVPCVYAKLSLHVPCIHVPCMPCVLSKFSCCTNYRPNQSLFL